MTDTNQAVRGLKEARLNVSINYLYFLSNFPKKCHKILNSQAFNLSSSDRIGSVIQKDYELLLEFIAGDADHKVFQQFEKSFQFIWLYKSMFIRHIDFPCHFLFIFQKLQTALASLQNERLLSEALDENKWG